MNLTIFDHGLVAVLMIVLPILSVTDYRALRSRLDAGRPTARLIFYRTIIAWSWGLTAAVAVLWLVNARPAPQLGLDFETGTGFWIGLALTVVACGLVITPAITLPRDPEKLRAIATHFDSVQEMIPRTTRDATEFAGLSITAGICEEIVYRGYLMIYLTTAIPIEGMWHAALLSSLVFGLAHAYQGPKGVLKTGVFGLVMAGLYLLTGSIWLPIVFHMVVDLVNGRLGRSALTASASAREPSHASADQAMERLADPTRD